MQVFVSFLILFSFFGCYNNSHIKTQRVLQEKEKVVSVSGAFNGVGMIDDRVIYREGYNRWLDQVEPYAPVAAIRGEYSVLEGYKEGELGYYMGGGVNAMVDEGVIGFIGGEYNKYLHLREKKPLKAGASLELNRTKNGFFALHSIQSVKTTTTKKTPLFFGIHTLFSKFDDPAYKQTTKGLGVTSGAEQFFGNRSIILQLDVSFVKNSINSLDKSFNLSSINSRWKPIISASAALSFSPKNFRGKSLSKKTNQVMIRELKNKEPSIKALINDFNPETGEKIKKNNSEIIFDPETGEKIKKNNSETIFDPETGEKIKL